jgi:hypothetical protein
MEAEMADRTTKTLLLAVALGLWANAMSAWMYPAPAHAAQPRSQNLAFVDYWQLVQEKRAENVSSGDIQILLLTHIAANTAATSR